MAESKKPLKFWMSGEIQSDVNDEHRKARKAIESQVNECIDKRDYGEGLTIWSYLAIILNDDTNPYYPEVKRYRKKRKEVEFRLKIDHEKFLEGDSGTHLRLLAQSILRSLELMKDMNIRDFDLYQLTVDVRQCLSRYL